MSMEWDIHQAVRFSVPETLTSPQTPVLPNSVRSLMFNDFKAYVRVLHPARKILIPPSANHAARWGTVLWADVAKSNGRTPHAAMEWNRISRSPTDAEPLFDRPPTVGSLSESHIGALSLKLRYLYGKDAPCWFLFPEVAGLDVPEDIPRFNSPSGPAIAFVGMIGDVYRTFQLNKPSYWGSFECRWAVSTEIDLDSTHIGGSDDLIEAIMHEPELESFTTSRDELITSNADTIN